MTSYMYNPSKKITEFLSQYLEFDPEQLKLGIWSGNLSLEHVNLREEAIYPLLNGATSSTFFGSDAEHRHQQDYAKPPLRLKLASGKIGSLSIRIPWKRLVWGAGDVQVNVRDVTIALEMESREETLERMKQGSESSHSGSLHERFPFESDGENDEKAPLVDINRRKKQQILQAAERRNVAGKSIGPWLQAIKKQDEEERAKIGNETPTATKSYKEKESWLLRWLRETTSDFLWRFCIGLQMNIENVMVVFVQEDIEIGLMMPSNNVLSGTPTRINVSTAAIRKNENDGSICEDNSVSAPLQKMSFEGRQVEDGEQIHKQVKSVGIGLFVRQISHHHFVIDNNLQQVPVCVARNDSILRPLDVDFSFSVFFPVPIDKRKRKVEQFGDRIDEHMDEESSTLASGSGTASNKRRGKREKQPIQRTDSAGFVTEATPAACHDRQSLAHRRVNTASVDFPSLTPPRTRRMSSLGSRLPLRYSHIASLEQHERTRSVALSLVHPEALGAALVPPTNIFSGMSAQMRGCLSLGTVDLVFSNRHYYLINTFLASVSRMRNGRPRKNIRSVLDSEQSCRRELADASIIASEHAAKLEEVRAEKVRLVHIWWHYAFGVLFWELGQRKRLRRVFHQKFVWFSWERQQYKRREYVSLYIAVRLKSVTKALVVSTHGSIFEEQLLAIEDVLPVEQLLLYRSLARKVFVSGEEKMPCSILDLKEGRGGSQLKANFSGGDVDAEQDENGDRGTRDDGSDVDEFDNLLALLRARCEVARQRQKSGQMQLPTFGPVHTSDYVSNRNGVVDDVSSGWVSTKTTKSAASGVVNPLETAGSPELTSIGMQFEFAVSVRKIEFSLVEQENELPVFRGNTGPVGVPLSVEQTFSAELPNSLSSGDGNSRTTDTTASELSALTEDDRFLQDSDVVIAEQSELAEPNNPILTTDDFLISRGHEKVLLKLVTISLAFSALGRMGESRNLKFSIDIILATTEQGEQVLEIGSTTDEAQVHNVDTSRHASQISADIQIVPKHALKVSFLDKNNHNCLQCDTSTIQVKIDPLAILPILAFPSKCSVVFPQPLLKRSPQEEVRLYILQQSGSSFVAWDCSVRLHGCKISLPLHPSENLNDDDHKTKLATSRTQDYNQECAVVCCHMVELYTGKAVDDLCLSEESIHSSGGDATMAEQVPQSYTQTRSLSLLSISDRMRTKRSSLSSHWLAVASGIDICVNAQYLFDKPMDIEVYYIENADSLLDFNRAKQVFVVEVSPLHVLISEKRIASLSRVNADALRYCLSHGVEEHAEVKSLPLRLEALSRLMRHSVDFSIGRVRLSIFTEESKNEIVPLMSKQLEMQECMNDFLILVSHFDLCFPHEEAIFDSMQICIDKLTGIGLPLEKSGEAANLVLLNFLEDMATARKQNCQGLFDPKYDNVGKHNQAVLQTIRKSAERTAALYTDHLHLAPHHHTVEADFVIDLPGGLSLMYVACFYDFYVGIGIANLSLASGTGVHVVRITAPEDALMGHSHTSRNLSHGHNPKHCASSDRTSETKFSQHSFCISFQKFVLDRGHHFGSGGLPLSILGSDERAEGYEKRVREHIDDVEVGDIDFLFSHRIFHDLFTSLLKILPGPGKFQVSQPSPERPHNATTKHFYGILTVASATVVFVSDGLLPFTRLMMVNVLSRSVHLSHPVEIESESSTQPPYSLIVEKLGLINLTPEGELFPQLIEILPEHSGPCLVASFCPREIIKLEVAVHELQVTFLKQYLSECLQYFVSGSYGVGQLLKSLAKNLPPKSSAEKRDPFRFQIALHDISLILPSSTSSFEMLCIESEKIVISSTLVNRSFKMPVGSDPLILGSEVSQECGDPREPHPISGPVSRKIISIEGFRVYSSLPKQLLDGKPLTSDSPSFRFFYKIDGRARAGKQVYRPIFGLDRPVLDDSGDLENNTERSTRVWLEVTAEKASLDIIIDYAPHRRILVLDSLSTGEGLELDMRLSQFCLMLSVWFENMQELPMMFPFTAAQLQLGALYHDDFKLPDYGSEAFRSFLKDTTCCTSEVGILMKRLSLRCTFDQDHMDTSEYGPDVPSIFVGFESVVIHITSDTHGVSRISSGSSKGIMIDESLIFANVLDVGELSSEPWADLRFGLEGEEHSLAEPLPQAFQLSIFMTPDWTLYNLGLETPNLVLSDLRPVFRFLQFVTEYFSDAQFGNPAFQALELAQKLKEDLRSGSRDNLSHSSVASGLEFRLWLRNPNLFIPCDPTDKYCPGVQIHGGGGGLWYKYTSFNWIVSHEVVSDCLHLVFKDSYTHRHAADESEESGRSLLERLSLGFRYDINSSTYHRDIAVQIPHVDSTACGLTSPRITVLPTALSPPTVCTPVETLERSLGPIVCEMTCIIELLPLTTSALLNFFDGSDQKPRCSHMARTSSSVGDGKAVSTSPDVAGDISSKPMDNRTSFSFVACVGDFRIFALDPVLGPHLPVAVVSVSRVSVTASTFVSKVVRPIVNGAPAEDLQISVIGSLWADYFKLGLTRSWEPLIEAYQFTALIEKSQERGLGLTYSSDTDLHINISSALLVILDEVVDVFKRLIQETLDDGGEVSRREESRHITNQLTLEDKFGGQTILHELPQVVAKGDRVAFFLRNKTGQSIRIYRSHPQGLLLTYLNHNEVTKLNFLPSISMVINLSVKEVAYPGLPTGFHRHHANVPAHTIDVQPVGFRLLKSIAVDTFGRTFAKLVPQSVELRNKLDKDWRLSNAMNLLVEVGLENGGRQVTVRSIFSIVNKTSLDVCLLFNPDPSFNPPLSAFDGSLKEQNKSERISGGRMEKRNKDEHMSFRVKPGASVQVPCLTLFAGALHHADRHLGLMWMKPKDSSTSVVGSFLADDHSNTSSVQVEYCSRPVEFAAIITETSSMFADGSGHNLASAQVQSGVHISCPVVQNTGNRVAPFCYVLEVGRSPVVVDPAERGNGIMERSNENGPKHGPVAYTLSLHPPIILANLLSVRGRFELMHAVHRNVLWYGDLEPGKEVAVHSVGLDAPLILLINVGFAKTPIGEGILVHHGADPPAGAREHLGLKTIGRAGKAVTKQLGNIIAMSDTPNKRGQRKIFDAQNPHISPGDLNKQHSAWAKMKSRANIGAESNNRNTYTISESRFFPSDVADEMSVVDGIGQRLTLNVENVLGGGGQRRVAVFCRFWILNTTEHCLRYKQEGSKQFVSGTVLSPAKNGSLPVSGGRGCGEYKVGEEDNLSMLSDPYHPPYTSTIFSGTPGALASFPGRCDLPADTVARLIDNNMPLEKISQLAFMFNFHEGKLITAGNQKLSVQLGDGTGMTKYESDYSRGFSLDIGGIPQVVSLHCKDGRSLEVICIVFVAPGFLSRYTKIVRFLPRYVCVNTLPYPIRLWQDNSIFRPLSADSTSEQVTTSRWRFSRARGRRNESTVNQYEALWGRETVLEESDNHRLSSGTAAHASALYIATVMPSDIIPFSLPDSRGERHLRVDLGLPWNLTSSIFADVPGDHVLKMRKAVDLRVIPHVSTRSNPQYEVWLPPNGGSFAGELGIWFETEFGASQSLIVKAVKKNSFAFNETDIHVGDELLAIDGTSVSCMTFSDAMNILRKKLMSCSCDNADLIKSDDRQKLISPSRPLDKQTIEDTATEIKHTILSFCTVEERLRRVRLKAARANKNTQLSQVSRESTRQPSFTGTSFQSPASNSNEHIKVELKPLQQSDLCAFVLLRGGPSVPFQIQNRCCYTINYRQHGCNQHQWNFLKPGQTNAYTWEEALKPKKLIVRVELTNAFHYTEEAMATNSRHDNQQNAYDITRQGRDRQRLFQKVKGEEESVYSPSVAIRLEEIGLQETLHVDGRSVGGSSTGSSNSLRLEVSVEGSARVLTVFDALGDSNEEQLQFHLTYLEKMTKSEQSRNEQLKMLNGFIAPPSTGALLNKTEKIKAVSTAMQLMHNFSSVVTITQCHQIVVEVLEAVGLSAASFVGSCNPYAEVHLHGKRKNLFKKEGLRQTYYIRKSVNPTWNSQSFVFDVPCEAVSVTRGYSIHVCLKNFRVFGTHNTLGRVQVDLHSLRNQKPLVGWFPLIGQTGRREIENQFSPWGRGSVKLKVQWIHAIPSLIQYFIMLSENRLFELQNSLEGMAQLLEKEIQRKKILESDGFKAARMDDLIALSRMNMKTRKSQIQKLKKLNRSVAKKTSISTKHHLAQSIITSSRVQQGPSTLSKLSEKIKYDACSLSFVSPNGGELRRKRLNSSNGLVQNIEEKILQQRKSIDRQQSNRARFERKPPSDGDAGILGVRFFRFWSSAKALFNDRDFDIELQGEFIKIALRMNPEAEHNDLSDLCSYNHFFELPQGIPAVIQNSLSAYISEFTHSRSCFERVASMSLSTVLHAGGWLTIRPITALNLPEIYSGMFVKVRYGSEIFLSDTVDARVTPTWNNEDAIMACRDGINCPSAGSSAEEDMEDLCSNHLHVHVAPQKTSCSIRLSVVGERLHTKTEIGILDLPVGALIAACRDSTSNTTKSSSVFLGCYVRWFPLIDPKDALHVEGDEGMSTRPLDTEKTDDSMFQDYFTPCIKLAVSWSPDEAEGTSTEGSLHNLHSHTQDCKNSNISSLSQPLVTNYINADIGRISFSLIDSQNSCELLSLCIHDIDLRYWTTKSKKRLGMTVGWIQLDFQNSDREPVVLAPTPTDNLVPVLQIMLVQDKSNRNGSRFCSLDLVDISLTEFDLTIEERLVFDIAGFFQSIRNRKGVRLSWKASVEGQVPSKIARGAARDSNIHSFIRSDFHEEIKEEQKMYVKELYLGVVKINLSYLKGKRSMSEGWGDSRLGQVLNFAGGEYLLDFLSFERDKSDVMQMWKKRTFYEEQHAEEQGKNQSVAAFFVAFLPAVSDAPVRLPSKVLRHVFERPSDIMQNIRKFYVTETLKQIYKIVGSLDFVGNPTMLVSSFVSGVKDLVVAPSMAFWKSPTDPSRVGLSVVQGAISLMSHSASGFFGALAKLASRAGQSVAIVSLDRDFRVWHRNKVVLEAANLNRDWKRRGVQKVEQILSRPVADIILGITGGVSGLVVLPVKGYQQHGSVGVIQGIAVGGIGLIAKPLVGILDAFTHFTSSIHDIAKSVNVLDKRHQPAIRLRMPYIFGVQSILAPYDPVLARAKNLLKNFPMSKPLSTAEERMVHTEVLPSTGVETYVIVTTMRIILLKVKKEATGILSASRCWQIIFSTQSSISSQVVDHGHTGVAMTLLLQKQDPERSSPAVGIESLEEAAAAAAAVLSDASMFAPESQAGEVSTPSQQYLQDAATDSSNYGHGMQRDEEGGLHEWYTIVAEYQYRRQLSRLHNSISCVQGNIDAIIHDPSFTNSPRSSEGYTSFGMFHFEAKNTSGDNEKDVEIDNLVENCPWVSEDLFEASRGMNAEEQTLFLANLHERWTFPDELNASHSRLWFLDAGADESFVLPSKIATGSIDNLNLSSDTSLIPAHELADHNQPAFDDVFDENSATETETSKTFVSALQMSSLLLDTSENSTSDSRPDIESTHATTVKEQVLSPLDYTLSTVSAQSCTLPEKGTPTGLDQLIIHRPTTDHLTNATTHDSQENRFVRIERLMERLLIFSAEQALAQSHQPQQASLEDVALLRQEIAELRKRIEISQSTTREGSSEITSIRNEIASLRDQLGLL